MTVLYFFGSRIGTVSDLSVKRHHRVTVCCVGPSKVSRAGRHPNGRSTSPHQNTRRPITANRNKGLFWCQNRSEDVNFSTSNNITRLTDPKTYCAILGSKRLQVMVKPSLEGGRKGAVSEPVSMKKRRTSVRSFFFRIIRLLLLRAKCPLPGWQLSNHMFNFKISML